MVLPHAAERRDRSVPPAGAAERAYEAFARELETSAEPAPEMAAEICRCVGRLAATLKPEYAEALEAVELRGLPVKTYAEQKGLTAGQRGRAGLPRPSGAQAARRRIVRPVRRARLHRLPLPRRRLTGRYFPVGFIGVPQVAIDLP